MSDLINPYAPPQAEIPAVPGNPLSLTTVLAKGWEIYRAKFLLIAVIVTIVWLPCDVVSSYMDNFVFSEEQFMKSFRFSQFLENFFGIIATAGVLSLALQHTAGGSISFGQAVGSGFSLWPKMWWTRLLSNLLIVLSLLLFIIPFFIVFPRLLLVESVVVSEHESGTSAIKRSYELTRGSYWAMFRLFIVLTLIVAVPAIGLMTIPEVVPALDHWLTDAFLYLLSDIVVAYQTVTLYCAYQACQFKQNTANPA